MLGFSLIADVSGRKTVYSNGSYFKLLTNQNMKRGYSYEYCIIRQSKRSCN
ncbi:hypothetical protein KCTCHS21_35900 [Cohnella abietis]|uniref:Uncharacterized protein n=1 Tax=Cohnella abietis TaxID=2507935 RepID=A0A3T1D7X9_9BACL|nr:hypothetical protein KCTCHS21_35900 [Cohnella abietis]